MEMGSRIKVTRLFLLFAVFGVFSCCIAVFAFLDRIPSRVVELYGEPDPGMKQSDRFVYSLQLLYYEKSLLHPHDPKGSFLMFTVPMGESVVSVATRLYQEGFIVDPDAFRLYLVYRGIDKTVQAGKFRISPSMSAVQIAQALQDPNPTETTIRILAGWRLEEVAAALPPTGVNVQPDEFIKAAYAINQFSLSDGSKPLHSFEGFLFPDFYQVNRGVTAFDLVAIFSSRYKEKVTPDLVIGFGQQKLTVFQATILASIIQKEAALEDEMPLIASVFLNRLAKGMRLESDPTVQYALGYNAAQRTWWTNPLSLTDLRVDSPYNTYLRGGLPPGPICNPGMEALKAVARPAQTGYYFFRLRCDGSKRHNFAITYEEHLKNGCK